MRMQGDKQWLRKQLAVKAVVRSEQRETSNGKGEPARSRYVANVKGLFELQGYWRVWWPKRESDMEVVYQEVSEDGLVRMRI